MTLNYSSEKRVIFIIENFSVLFSFPGVWRITDTDTHARFQNLHDILGLF